MTKYFLLSIQRGGGGEAFEVKHFNLFEEELFLHIIFKIQDNLPVNTHFIRL